MKDASIEVIQDLAVGSPEHTALTQNQISSLNKLSKLEVLGLTITSEVSISRLLSFQAAAESVVNTFSSLQRELQRRSCAECGGDGWQLHVISEQCIACEGSGTFSMIEEDLCRLCGGDGKIVTGA